MNTYSIRVYGRGEQMPDGTMNYRHAEVLPLTLFTRDEAGKIKACFDALGIESVIVTRTMWEDVV